MNYLKNSIEGYKKEKKQLKKTPLFAPGGQSTQLVVGATPETDYNILGLAENLYQQQKLRRVYYSGYIPVSKDNRLPQVARAPLIRENRLYQADWLFRFYGFSIQEIINEQHPNLDLDIDPKFAYALRHPHLFPVDVNKDSYEQILRVPGIGVKSAKKIIQGRKFAKLGRIHLKKMGIALNRAKYFILTRDNPYKNLEIQPQQIKKQVIHQQNKGQLSLF